MKVIIIGKSGQLANELVAELPVGIDVLSLGRNDVDITLYDNLSTRVHQFQPNVIINASAYTAVDKAESDSDAAYAINETAVAVIAKVAKEHNCRFLHVSTDFVFDGDSNQAYDVFSQTNPTSVYGASKLAGELAIKNTYPMNSAIIRTSWVYSTFGNNFVKTMLRLMKEKEQLGVVGDQIGCPTSAKGLAQFLWLLASQGEIKQVYHWSDAGVASWYDFAVAIQELGLKHGLLDKKIPISAIASSSYPTPAKRPKFSLLNSSESALLSKPVHWREQLDLCLIKLSSENKGIRS
ncbi:MULTISPECIES: dTDP-4-dehydrorhamnose reductase [Colwellia]|uniref:dTDP-4-dehydrorhamnose reductase n=1 Tax=Colwellia marinimaniae TaxID=1513592 RepID=A0ABQ0MX99_9GAMM|nr:MULTISPECIES: dTDP-4-dehydrorhamnose reductase [Colwellia]GAW96970.1 NAD(P)-dependent oxidoreductase [Colwellia marinimaniae]